MTHRDSAPRGAFAFILSLVTFGSFGPAHASGWMSDGNPLAIVVRNQIYPVAVSDGAGGAIMVWQDSRNSSGESHSFDIYAQRVDATGNTLWSNNGVAVCTLPGSDSNPEAVADGAGGAIVVWNRTTGPPGVYWDIQAQRIDASGSPVWELNGVPVGATAGFQSGQQLIGDGGGGAIFAWYSNTDIYVQRIDAGGSALWNANGLGLCVKAGRQQEPVLTTDGVGGAIVAWSDTLTVTGYDIYARRVTSAGSAQWISTGVAICTAPSHQLEPLIVDDGVGGAIVAWRDHRGGIPSDIYMQRINGLGIVQWAPNGAVLSAEAGWQAAAELLRQGDYILSVWGDSRNGSSELYAQRIELSGTLAWDSSGIPICSAAGDRYEPEMTGDGQGGAIVAWTDSRDTMFDVYAQRFDENGQVKWIEDGAPVCTADWHQHFSSIASDGSGGAMVTWSDDRSGIDPDVYAQHLGPEGPTLTGVDRAPPVSQLHVLPNRPNPFGETSVVEMRLDAPSDIVMEVFDVGGRRVRRDAWPSRESGWNRFTVHARDENGRMLPSGVYFLRVSASRSTVTRKIVIAR
jgi:FlgD Ig-like domain